MHLRRHGKWFEIWSTAPRARQHRWLATRTDIPLTILHSYSTTIQTKLRERCAYLVRGDYPEPLPVVHPDAWCDDALAHITEACSLLRWNRLTPSAASQLLVASVRLQKSLHACGVSIPARGRRRKPTITSLSIY